MRSIKASSPSITIKVTKEDIRKGKPGIASSCPIAKALRRATRAREVVVGLSTCKWKKKGVWFSYSVLGEVQNFIGAFDGGWRVKPFSFEMHENLVSIVGQ